MSHHDQSHMPVHDPGPACPHSRSPSSPLVILVEPLDYPPVVGQDHLVLEAPGVQAPGEAVFGLSLLPRQGALPDEPTCSREGFASTTNPVNPHSSELLGQIALGPFRQVIACQASWSSSSRRALASRLGIRSSRRRARRGLPWPWYGGAGCSPESSSTSWARRKRVVEATPTR